MPKTAKRKSVETSATSAKLKKLFLLAIHEQALARHCDRLLPDSPEALTTAMKEQAAREALVSAINDLNPTSPEYELGLTYHAVCEAVWWWCEEIASSEADERGDE